MNESKTLHAENADSVQKEDARIGYQVAVNLWIYQGQLNWHRFDIMLVANSIIIAGIVVSFSSQSGVPSLFANLLPIVGLFLCSVWAHITARGFVYHKYWSSQARILEQEYLADTVRIVADARSTKEGGEIAFTWLSELVGLVKTERVPAYLVIVLLAVMYVVALLKI